MSAFLPHLPHPHLLLRRIISYTDYDDDFDCYRL